jgi:hypothetical protein
VRLTYGSPAAVVQVILIVPPMTTFVGVLRVRAEAKGATSTRRLRRIVSFLKINQDKHSVTCLINLENILNGRIEKKCYGRNEERKRRPGQAKWLPEFLYLEYKQVQSLIGSTFQGHSRPL